MAWRGGLLFFISNCWTGSADTFVTGWRNFQDKHIDPPCSSEEYQGDFGKMNAHDCLTSASNQNVNYAVWRGDADEHCYVCRITARGPSESWRYALLKGADSFAKDGPPPAPPPPPPEGLQLDVGGLHVEFFPKTFTVQALNVSVQNGSVWGKGNNFSFIPKQPPHPGCHNLGDITLRVRPADGSDIHTWAMYSSASATGSDAAPAVKEPGALLAHDITSFLNNTSSGANPFFKAAPVRIVRAYEAAPNHQGFILRFNITNMWGTPLRLGGLGLAMPQTGQRSNGIENSVWNDPHIGGDHGFVEWVRVVVEERTLLAVPHKGSNIISDQSQAVRGANGLPSRLEAWRPIMENTCGGETWEFTMYSEAWAAEWANGKQWPYLWMSDQLNKTGMWPEPKTPWPAWHGHDTVPITDHEGIAQPWNTPTSKQLEVDETLSVAVHIFLAEGGPRTRDDALAKAGKAVIHAVPGYVLSLEMTTARLFVRPPLGHSISSVSSSDSTILKVSRGSAGSSGFYAISVQGMSRGRCRVSITFDDGTTAQVHYMILPAFDEQVQLLGKHWANDAWLPRDYPDPFGRSASVMPFDRERKERVIDDSRAYDVGLSDDAGGGNPLGFAMKVGHAPLQDEVTRLDDFIKWTLYGIKPDVAKPPFKSLQIREGEPGMESETDGIRMTMYYYDNAGHPSKNYSGHFSYDYKEVDKCGLHGIEGGPNWCMSENNANATYRAFNFPHHTASYYAMYRIARNHEGLKTYQPWQWYLERAANTTLKFGSPSVGVMDGTVFREVLRSLREEATAQSSNPKWASLAVVIEENMRRRAEGFAAQEYPYGSEFSFDTTGQEEVVVWLQHFANTSNNWTAIAERTVDHILSYMRSSPTWPYHGGTRSWGDLGNNGKWMVSSGTGFETRGNLHYRSGLNMIPLIEWYRTHPDDFFLLEVAMGAQAGQLANIDESGAPSMMLHMLPHVLDFDPHSGDFGLGFFGHTLEAGAYLVRHKDLGDLCFLCDFVTHDDEVNRLVFVPRDSYRQRVYLEPLGIYLQLDTGHFKSISLDLFARRLALDFVEVVSDNATFATRRLRVNKEGTQRPGHDFKVTEPAAAPTSRGAYEFAAATSHVDSQPRPMWEVVIEWDEDVLFV